jgi:hypothetical protein
VNTIIAWLRSKNITTKSVIAGAIGIAIWIAASPAAQEWIKTTLAAHPQLASLIVLASVAIAQQNHSSSPAGAMAQARDVVANNPLTVAQVDAADTKVQ